MWSSPFASIFKKQEWDQYFYPLTSVDMWFKSVVRTYPYRSTENPEWKASSGFFKLISKTMKKVRKLRNTSDDEIGLYTEAGFAKIKTAIVVLTPQAPILHLAPKKH